MSRSLSGGGDKTTIAEDWGLDLWFVMEAADEKETIVESY